MKKIILGVIALVVIATGFGIYYNNTSHLPKRGEPLVFDAKVRSTMEESIFVETDTQEDFTLASISIIDDTEITLKDGTVITVADIKAGDNVTITNYGLLTDGTPVQMTARSIVVNK